MSELNTVILEGHLTKNAELSFLQTGTAICKFSIANNKSKKNTAGEYESIASFFDAELWGPYAQSMAPHLTKGKHVAITGRLSQDRWTKDGQNYSKIKITVDELRLFPGKKENQPQQENQPQPEGPENLDEIPF